MTRLSKVRANLVIAEESYTLPIYIIKFCSEECERQQSGEISIYNMCRAWILAKAQTLPTKSFILDLAGVIEPEKNAGGFRKTPITIDGQVAGIHPDNISHAINGLVDAMLTFGSIEPPEVYQEFESIYPFLDGNGRVGTILYNFLKGTLDTPTIPPEYKKR